jgi:DNA polymerase-3 subunit delta
MTITLLKGSDPVLLEDAAVAALRVAVGDADRGEVLDEFRGDDYELGEVCLAATTVSMFGDRVVVARNLARFNAKEIVPLVELLVDPPTDVSLVLVWDRPIAQGARANAVPKKLSDAVKAVGGDVVDTSPPGGKGRRGWFAEQFEAAAVSLDPSAKALIEDYVGEEVGRLPALLDLIAAANPGEDRVGPQGVLPLLGDSGGVPPWDLTDAIDRGDTARSVELLRRMVGAGGRHPLAVMATLQTHYERMLRLDGSGVRDEKAAAALLGMKGSAFPAKKAMTQSARLGHMKLVRATRLLAQADVDLRGATATPAEAVMELLVARLSTLVQVARV